MDIDYDKIDQAVLALLYLSFDEETHRAWKGLDWDSLDRLYAKGFIGDPKNKNKSVIFSDAGFLEAKMLFEKMFLK